MSEKTQKAEELFRSGYNCSQSVLGAFCQDFGLDFDTAVKIASSFGGGMGRMREVCGAVSGMFMVLGLAYSSSDNSYQNKSQQYKRVQDLAQRFKEKHGSIICRELLAGVETSNSLVPEQRNENYYKKRPCVELVKCCAEMLEMYLKENVVHLNH